MATARSHDFGLTHPLRATTIPRLPLPLTSHDRDPSPQHARGHYAGAEYIAAKLLTELPLDAAFAAGFGALLHWRVGLRLPPSVLVGTLALTAATCAGLGLAVGSLAADGDSALAMALPLMVVFMVLGIVNPSGTAATKPPSALVRALANASPLKWAIRALCVGELRGLKLDAGSLKDAPRVGALALVQSGDEVLDRLGLRETPRQCGVRLMQLLATECAVAAIGLWLMRPRYQPMVPPA